MLEALTVQALWGLVPERIRETCGELAVRDDAVAVGFRQAAGLAILAQSTKLAGVQLTDQGMGCVIAVNGSDHEKITVFLVGDAKRRSTMNVSWFGAAVMLLSVHDHTPPVTVDRLREAVCIYDDPDYDLVVRDPN